MKKRRKYGCAVMAAILIAVSAGGCSAETPEASSQTEAVSASAESEETMVEITIPAVYFEGKTLEQVKKAAQAQGAESVRQLEDGSYQYEMTASAQRRLVSEMRLNLLDEVSQLAGGESYPSIQSAELSADLSQLTLTAEREAYEKGNDRAIVRAIWPLVEIFYYCNGEDPAEKCLTVTAADGETGDEIETFQWPEEEEEASDSSAAGDGEEPEGESEAESADA